MRCLPVLLLLAAGACQAAPTWQPLLDDPSAWEGVSLGGEGEVRVEAGGPIELAFGSPLTAAGWRPEALPFTDLYEVEVVASRLDGTDFFCALNLPLGDQTATVVLGGWGGALCGLSCVDGMDASMNQTRSFQDFVRGKPVRLRVRVDAQEIAAWLDDEALFVIERSGHEFSLRTEVEPVGRLGVSSFQTSARIHSMRWRPLQP